MLCADDLYDKLREIESLIREKTNPDGSFSFDLHRVIVALELVMRMIVQEDNSD